MKNPLLSILIATRNRVPYCINAIETILSFKNENFELIIQDNSDSLELQEYIDKRESDIRLVYNYTPSPFSSIDNFNAVIGLSKGEYLCLIGDDDAVHPDIFKAIEWAAANNIPSVVPTLKAIYRWPDACDNPNDNGLLTIAAISGKVRIKKTNKSIKRLMQNGGQGYLDLPFPKLYHGIVRREYLERIKAETGNYVGGLSPDIYIAIGLAKHIPAFVEIDYPLTLPGICGISAPIDEKRNRYEKLEDAPHFRDRGPYQWSEQVPRFYSGSNIWADSALAAIRELNLSHYLKYFNKYHLGNALISRSPDRKDQVIRYLKTDESVITYYFQILAMKLTIILRKVFLKLKNKSIEGFKSTNSLHKYKDVQDVKEAVAQLKSRVQKFEI